MQYPFLPNLDFTQAQMKVARREALARATAALTTMLEEVSSSRAHCENMLAIK